MNTSKTYTDEISFPNNSFTLFDIKKVSDLREKNIEEKVNYIIDDKYTEKQKTHTSKFISLVLRHQPDTAGITLDAHGWADVPKLLNGMAAAGYPADPALLEEIVRTDAKQRYAFNEDHTKYVQIRDIRSRSIWNFSRSSRRNISGTALQAAFSAASCRRA